MEERGKRTCTCIFCGKTFSCQNKKTTACSSEECRKKYQSTRTRRYAISIGKLTGQPRKPFAQDLSGKQFGRLTVIEYAGRAKHNGSTWLCRCTCGKTKVIQAINLKSGNSQSCGCIKIEQSKARAKPHGLVNSSTYASWSNMLSRCFNPQKNDAPFYKDRGITVCSQWKDFDNFLADMGEKPNGYYIDRIDNNGNYEPSNCRWISSKHSARNKSTSKIWIVSNKEFETLEEAALFLNVTSAVIHRRCCGRTCRGKFLPKYEGYGFEYKYPKEQHAIYK